MKPERKKALADIRLERDQAQKWAKEAWDADAKSRDAIRRVCHAVSLDFDHADYDRIVAEVERIVGPPSELEKLRAFKAFVHRKLDEEGVPTDPPGEHRDAGCRIGQRLEFLFDREEKLVERLNEANEKLGTYGQHLQSCRVHEQGSCNCGYGES